MKFNFFEDFKKRQDSKKQAQEEDVKKKKEQSLIKGEGFIMGGEHPYSNGGQVGPSVEFRSGENSETARVREEEEGQQHEERRIQIILDELLKTENKHSDIFVIQPDGEFSYEHNFGTIISIFDLQNPADLYKWAKKVQSKYPEYIFTFENDPEGKWIKYTVSRSN